MQLLKANEGILMQVLMCSSQVVTVDVSMGTVVKGSWNTMIVFVMKLDSGLAWPIKVLRRQMLAHKLELE